MLNYALKYRSLGLSVIPLRQNGKEPLILWAEFQKRRATEQEIKEWWNAVPNANIGIVTGKISDLIVVDLDGMEGIGSAQKLGLTSSLVSLTGNGKHLWYKNNPNVQNSVRTLPGVDIRAEGGYIVAPPSIHKSGKRYRWLNGHNPVQIMAKLQPFPTALWNVPADTKVDGNRKEEGWIAKALQEMKNGNIDDTLFTVCSRLRADGYSADDTRVLLSPHAERAGATPRHLEDKITNVWNRYEPRESSLGLSSVSTIRHSEGLIIHSPTNADSIKQFEQRAMETGSGPLLSTGYPKLDQMLQGGLKSSRLFTLAARTGVGKTNWLLATAREICRSGKIVLLFSTEMPYTQIWERYCAFLRSDEDFREHKFYVCDSFAPNLERVEEAVNEIKPDVFMFDHINHVSEEVRGLGEFMQGLNFLRRKYECAGIVTAQLNRAADWVDLKTGEKVTPRMSMIKGSGTIEQASSRVLLLSETRVIPEGTEIVGNLDKNDAGDKGLIHFMLKRNPYRMVEL